jgi:predicted dehydrogenase
MRFLVVGAGSVGTRHCRNLAALGHQVLVWDVDERRLAQAPFSPKVHAVHSFGEGLHRRPDAVLVCTPPASHLSVARQALAARVHVFVEKPIAPRSDGVHELLTFARQQTCMVSVGYNLRFLPSLRKVRSLLREGRIGRVLTARAQFGFYLPAWRPGSDYRDNYAVSRELGGGILLDAIHELDYLGWMLGDAIEVSCTMAHVSDLVGDTEDVAEVTLRFADGAVGHVHLDYVRRAYRRTLEVVGTDAVVEWDYPSQGVTIHGPQPDQTEDVPIEGIEADMYVEEVKHLVACIETQGPPMVDGAEALRSLRLVEAAKESASTGRVVKL